MRGSDTTWARQTHSIGLDQEWGQGNGHYRLSFDLVQRIEGTLVPLPILPVELSYAVPGGLR